jgi:hypothetical protein
MGAGQISIALDHRRLRKLLFRSLTITCASALMGFSASASEQRSVESKTGTIKLSIPAEPLSKALTAFSAATGFEVIVDGRQARHLESSPVAGELSPDAALRMLLVGTGLIMRDYAPGNVRLVASSATVDDPQFSPATSPHASYFAALQQMVLQTVCRVDIGLPESGRLAVLLWLTPSGAVARVKLLHAFGERQRDAVLSAAFEVGDVGAPPPAGLKQPITLVVRPLPAPGSRDCTDTAGSQMQHVSN